jgi:hypothetical protein
MLPNNHTSLSRFFNYGRFRWCDFYRSCHWTQDSRVQTRLNAMDSKGDKDPYHDFLRRGRELRLMKRE